MLHHAIQEHFLLFFYLLLLQLDLHLQLLVPHVPLVALLGRLLPPAARLHVVCDLLRLLSVEVGVGDLTHPSASVGCTCLLAATLLVEVSLPGQVLRCPRHLVLGVDVDGLLLEGKTGERVDQEVAELLIDVLLDIFAQHLILTLFLQLHGLFNVPPRSKDPSLAAGHPLDRLCDLLVLEVEGLHWPADEVVTADQLFLVVLVLLVDRPHCLVLQFVGS